MAPTPVPRTSRRGTQRLLTCLLLVAGLVLTGALPSSAAVSDEATPTAKANGIVYAVAQVGDLTVIGGEFTAVGGRPRQNLAALRPDGTVDPSFAPSVDGVVRALDGSTDGATVFVGGEFAHVNGAPRGALAALSTNGALSSWQADTNGIVHAVEVSGSTVYAAGTFTSIADVGRRRLAALDVATAQVFKPFNPWPSWTVKDIAVSPDGSKVYATGGFNRIGGQDRNGAAEVLASTGEATAFNPARGGVGLAAAVSPDGSRFFFSTTDNNLYAYDPAVSSSPTYAIKTGGDTQAIAASSTEVYFGGHFRNVNTFKTKRNLLASITLDGQQLTSWNPHLGGDMGPWSIDLTDNAVLVGGDFCCVGGKHQRGIAVFHGTP